MQTIDPIKKMHKNVTDIVANLQQVFPHTAQDAFLK